MKNKLLIALDLDGTITQHKSMICSDNLHALLKVSQKHSLVIIGAGSCNRISKQLNGLEIDIVGQYGMETAHLSKDGSLTFVEKNNETINKEIFVNNINYLREEFDLNNYLGESVEFHDSGIVTFPILGTKAKIEDKLIYDPDRKKRRKMLESVQSKFQEYNVFIGGSSSFDFSPLKYTKYSALIKYSKNNNFDEKDIIYFGDDYGVGGNDESIYKSNIKFVEVNNYTDLNWYSVVSS